MSTDNTETPAPAIDSVDDIVDLFNDIPDDKSIEEKPVETKPEETVVTEDEVKEEDELNLDEDLGKEEDKEDELKLDENEIELPFQRKEVLKKYPNLFKDFPQLEKAHYRANQYDEIFGTIADAKNVVQSHENLKAMEGAFVNGNLEVPFRAIAEGDRKAFNKIVDNFLPELSKVDPNATYHIMGKIIKDTIFAMAKTSQRDNNESLREAALELNKFIFNSTEFVPAQTYSRPDAKPDPEREKLENEKRQYFDGRLNESVNSIETRVENTIRSAIEKHIDPRNVMSEYIKKVAVGDAFKAVQNDIAKDASFRKSLDRLWERAARDNFSKDSLEKIYKSVIGRARVSTADAIKSSRNAAYKGTGRRVVDPDNNKGQRRIASSGGKVGESNGNKAGPQKGESVVDFFMRD